MYYAIQLVTIPSLLELEFCVEHAEMHKMMTRLLIPPQRWPVRLGVVTF